MTQSKTATAPSLRPYLSGFAPGLRVVIPALTADEGQGPMETSGPFAKVFEASVSSGDQGVLADLFLLVQPDHYDSSLSELQPISNPQVAQLWQDALAGAGRRHPGAFPPVFPEQLDENGRLLAMRPLFHCGYRRRWCHPLCPQCGRPLTVCRDDGLLHDADLPTYGRSLERFLYCPACAHVPEGAVFYAPGRPSSGPQSLKGTAELLEGFSRLLSNPALAEELPCVGCPEAVHCFGAQTLVHERMRPLFFFTFFFLMLPAGSGNQLEFVDMLSGRSREEILRDLQRSGKAGRMGRLERIANLLPDSRGLLFPDDDRRFGEVLHLKLRLLEELFDLISSGQGRQVEPVACMSLESIWVHLPLQSAHLPWSWNFCLRLIDPVGRPAQGVFESFSAACRRRHFLGAAWCYLLLNGSGQGMDAIYTAVQRLASRTDEERAGAESDLAAIDPALGAHHLLADGAALEIGPRWVALWQRAVQMGDELLRAAGQPDPDWSEASFRKALDGLLRESRQALFEAPAEKPAAKGSSDPADRAIAAIVQAILDKWPPTAGALQPTEMLASQLDKIETPAPGRHDEDGDFIETVILGDSEDEERGADEDRPAALDLEKTVVIRPAGETSGPDDGSDDPQRTVIIKPPGNSMDAEYDLEKTVVIAPPTDAPANQKSDPGGKSRGWDADGDDLEKTVVIQSRKLKERKPKK